MFNYGFIMGGKVVHCGLIVANSGLIVAKKCESLLMIVSMGGTPSSLVA